MVLSPEKPEHASVEKATVHLVKEMWGPTTGLVFIAIACIIIIPVVIKALKMSGTTWVKFDTVYYLFINKERKSVYNSLYDGNDLLVFFTEGDQVINMKNYSRASFNKYFRAKQD